MRSTVESPRALPHRRVAERRRDHVRDRGGAAAAVPAGRGDDRHARGLAAREPGRVRVPAHARRRTRDPGSHPLPRDQPALLRAPRRRARRRVHPRAGAAAGDRDRRAAALQRALPARADGLRRGPGRRRRARLAPLRPRLVAASWRERSNRRRPGGRQRRALAHRPLARRRPAARRPHRALQRRASDLGAARGHRTSRSTSTSRTVYGPEWAWLRDAEPSHLSLAVGSPITVSPPARRGLHRTRAQGGGRRQKTVSASPARRSRQRTLVVAQRRAASLASCSALVSRHQRSPANALQPPHVAVGARRARGRRRTGSASRPARAGRRRRRRRPARAWRRAAARRPAITLAWPNIPPAASTPHRPASSPRPSSTTKCARSCGSSRAGPPTLL